ncbi:hypothetical protein VP01_697g2 [Puccinia sorghi]|uniref:Uncharacterized protein n=1 Tax=Puccinia sorghi TaxID=27349 RepID=A0A0L6UDZ0_9BASI|nr:hypothetical protein VP01_697g2 [Puccinia sorghi]
MINPKEREREKKKGKKKKDEWWVVINLFECFCPRFPRIAVCGFYQTQQLSSPLPTELSSATETVADADKNDSPPVIRSGGWSFVAIPGSSSLSAFGFRLSAYCLSHSFIPLLSLSLWLS